MFLPAGGFLHLAHSVHDMQEIGRRGHAIHLNGIDSEFLTSAQVKELVPFINLKCRYPVMGALLQRRGGTARPRCGGMGITPGQRMPWASILSKIARSTGFPD